MTTDTKDACSMTDTAIKTIAAQIVRQLPAGEVINCSKSYVEAGRVLSQYKAGNLVTRLEDAQLLVSEVHDQCEYLYNAWLRGEF
jgi:hypothetical protein